MQSELVIETIDTHTAGEPTRIVTGRPTLTSSEGGTVAEQRDRFADEFDHIRKRLMKEPRGHEDMFGAIPVRPNREDADLGLIFMNHEGYQDMCGHGTMGVVTALIETGRLEPKSPIRIETPAGIVIAHPEIGDQGEVKRVSVQNVTSYVIDSVEVPVSVDESMRTITADIVYAGNTFALVKAGSVDLSVDKTNTEAFVELGLNIRAAINDQCNIQNPVTGKPVSVELTEFYESVDGEDRNVVIFADGSVDRSPCGTGTCAKMTLLHNKNKLEIGEQYIYKSVIGTEFEGELRDYEDDGDIRITTPKVAGSAFITGKHSFIFDPNDPLPSFNIVER